MADPMQCFGPNTCCNIISCCICDKCCTNEIEVETPLGSLLGIRRHSSNVFLFRGIRYAKAPVGELRFRKPVPVEPWEGVYDARWFGKGAVQGIHSLLFIFLPGCIAAFLAWLFSCSRLDIHSNDDAKRASPVLEVFDEDCLFLNVETPSVQGKLPVIVWIHGGGYIFGMGREPTSYNSQSPMSQKGVVFVSINYRLGVFGFMKVEGGDYNCGLWDQIEALRWVKNNISCFGGDPDNVTIMGESAGGMSCGVLLGCGFAGELFHKAILHSGCLQMSGCREEQNIVSGYEFTKALGARKCSVNTFAQYSAAQLLAAQNKVVKEKTWGLFPFQPVIDGDLLHDCAYKLILQGSSKKVPVLIGYTREEETFFWKIEPKVYWCKTEEDMKEKLIDQHLGPKWFDLEDYESWADRVLADIKNAYPAVVARKDWTYLYVMLVSHIRFTISTHVAAHALASSGSPTYMFRFDVKSPAFKGAAHIVDLFYLFGLYNRFPTSVPLSCGKAALSKTMMDSWVEFARTGKASLIRPKKEHLDWPAIPPNETLHPLMTFDVPCQMVVEVQDLKAKLPSLWELGELMASTCFWIGADKDYQLEASNWKSEASKWVSMKFVHKDSGEKGTEPGEIKLDDEDPATLPV